VAKVPPWLRGVDLGPYNPDSTPQDIQITLLDVASDGTLTPASSSSLIGEWDEIDIKMMIENENIRSADSYNANYVELGEDDQFDITEILKHTGVNILAASMEGGTSQYALIDVARGDQAWQFYGIMTDYTEGLRHGKMVGRITCKHIDPGYDGAYFANPTYT
jgi:hypothetical protein